MQPVPTRPAVLYVSDVPPTETQASSALVYRHLRAMERANWEVRVATRGCPATGNNLPHPWSTVWLPSRRWYYPPYRDHALARPMRWFLLRRETRPLWSDGRVRAIISVLEGKHLALFAEWLSRSLHVPLFYFLHDRAELLAQVSGDADPERVGHLHKNLLRSPRLARVWTVAPELTYPDVPAACFQVVYPLAERLDRLADWQPVFAQRPVIAYAGSIYRELLPSLRAVAAHLQARGGRLELYSHLATAAGQLQADFPGVITYHGNVHGTAELCRRILSTCSGFLVPYPPSIQSMPWVLDCFPSKFTQLAQTGLPGIVIAPDGTAVSNWCRRNQWSLYSTGYDEDTLAQMWSVLQDRDAWSSAARETRRAATGDFCPDKAEDRVLADLASALTACPGTS